MAAPQNPLMSQTQMMDATGVAYGPNNPMPASMQAATAVSIAAGNVGNTIVKPGSGVYLGAKITSVGLGAPSIFDNGAGALSGTQLDAIVGSAALAFLSPVPLQGVKCLNGITVSGGATMPGMTVYFL